MLNVRRDANNKDVEKFFKGKGGNIENKLKKRKEERN